ncbi:saccharopine dehydrogenase family protein [Yinghuangia seranimata]|uniref:saccharopine dehydrogenase family protein n=1 Tax=Yinghuangia seranimata TaxID=408067 RepID=UPI00248ACC77|nr:saccharopine dehydrogenase NADP-binding domain-containing protein [Yinghuangia seranimata]MDI2131669.1 saccharopine dehydrogenase NADP-binding domain-containing protein [Yinghuangia seranimata]
MNADTNSGANTGAPRHTVALFGAYGHTARFLVDTLHRRGFGLALGGRDPERMRALAEAHPYARVHVASVDDPASLDALLAGTSLVVNAAGPFGDTTPPLIEAALRAGVHYIDITGEQPVTRRTFETYRDRLADSGLLFLPALGFFGALPDLLATLAMGDWAAADEISVAFALDSWHPTEGTRKAGARSAGHRVTVSGGELVPFDDHQTDALDWEFPGEAGTQPVRALGTADQIVISRHLKAPEVRAYMNDAPLSDLRDAGTPPPTAVDEDGRSAQTFLVDVVVRRGAERRAASATGRDIYAVTAPLVAEAVARVLDSRTAPHGTATGVRAPGEVFDAEDFLAAVTDLTYAVR